MSPKQNAGLLERTSRNAKLVVAFFPPVVLLLAGLTVTILTTVFMLRDSDQKSRIQFEAVAWQLGRAITHRMKTYEDALRHIRALFSIDRQITRVMFHDFVDTLDLQGEYPGIRGINFAPRIMARDLETHVARTRADKRPGFHVWPEGKRDEYFPITFVEPYNNASSRVLGFDPNTEARRRAAMERARDTGLSSASRMIQLHQDLEPLPQPAFTIYLPVYKKEIQAEPSVEERRKQLVGYVIAVFRAHDLFNEVLRDFPEAPGIEFTVYDGDATTTGGVFYSSLLHRRPREALTEPSGPAKYTSTIPVDFAKHRWMVSVQARPNFHNASIRREPWYIFIAGLLVSVLFYRLSQASQAYTLQLKRSEDQLRLVTDALPALVAYIDRLGIYRFANAAHFDWFGVLPDELRGHSFWRILERSTESAGRSKLINGVLEGRSVSTDANLKHRKLGVRQVHIECRPDISRGEVTGIIALVTDTTEKNAWTEKLKADKIALEAAAVERQLLLEEARSVNRAKDEFLATLSHELRTPLAVIQGHAELLKAGCDDPAEFNESIDSIYRNTKIQIQIVNDLLDVSSIITGKIDIHRSPMNLQETILFALEDIRAAASAKAISIDLDLGENNVTVNGDERRLQQVFWNLLSNSIKFTPQHGRVVVSLSRRKSGRYEVSITDTGKGIGEEFLPFVFDHFRQEDSSITRDFGGLGLGLSLVRNLVELHDGDVRVESSGRGRGACFIVSLPVCPQFMAEDLAARTHCSLLIEHVNSCSHGRRAFEDQSLTLEPIADVD